MDDNANNLARTTKVLSVSTRVRIVQLLREKPLCVNALAARLAVTQGAVSQHLRVMRDAGLVIDERRGYHVHYRLDPSTMARWRSEIDALLAVKNTTGTETTEGESLCHSKSTRCKTAKNSGT